MPLARKLRIAAGMLVLAAIALVIGWWYWIDWAPSRDTYPLQGITVSRAQGTVDWGSIRAQGVDFAYIRAISGDGRDPAFARNWAEARRAGLRYGAELAYDPCRPANEQATLFITTVPRDNAMLPPAVRLDRTRHCAGGQPGRDHIVSELNTLINLVEAHSGKTALLRVSKGFEAAYAVSTSINRTLWLERNFFTPDYAARPWVMWTANSERRIDGAKGAVEWNVVAP